MATPSKSSKSVPSVWSQIRSIVLVSFLAILIWLLAESRMIQSRMVELQIVLIGNTQDPEHRFVVRPTPGEDWSSSIDVELEGSLASLDQATRDLRGRIQLTVGDDIPSRQGMHDLDLRTLLRNLPSLRTNGVTVRTLSVDSARVQVDEVITLEMPVRVDLPQSVALDGPARAIPQTVMIEGPAALINTLEGRELLASPDPIAIAALTPGRLETIPSVAISLPTTSELVPTSGITFPGWSPILTPPRVDVRLTVRSLTQTTIIDRLPIQVLLAPGEVGRWDVALDPGSEDLVSIQISGPSDALELINSGASTPSAVLSLSFQDLERSITSKQIQLLGLPAGVQVGTELPEVSFVITPASRPSGDATTNDPADGTP